ncbi:MAG: endonuclease/exonuclease/phosphatase family protein [Candidatus Cloacimonetes bacterium]|nr:endonuclease/exonuclease/phosphatase family protein [Candidatus Cloacimonadota bacterium]
MTKAFSVASWNVKHFKGKLTRIDRVVDFLKDQNPDVFALYEVTGSEVFSKMTTAFPGYTFQITEGTQSQEILVGIKSTITAFITQKIEFKSGNNYMRPGLLVTITVDNVNYSLLFLHLASSTEPRGMGLRDDMLSRALKFRHKLDKTTGGKHTANYIFLGDLNTMGMNYPYDKDIEANIELKRLRNRASRYYGMHNLNKTFDKTWNGGSHSSYPQAELDHVYAAKHLTFKTFKDAGNNDAEVTVKGWVEEETIVKQDSWIDNYSDHALLYFEVQKV